MSEVEGWQRHSGAVRADALMHECGKYVRGEQGRLRNYIETNAKHMLGKVAVERYVQKEEGPSKHIVAEPEGLQLQILARGDDQINHG